MADQKLTEQESLQIITEMIQKVKPRLHTGGTSAILWGTAVAIAGLVSFAQLHWHFYIGFDIWLLVLAALIPQIFITLREKRGKKVTNYQEDALNGIWTAYGIGIFALVFYLRVIPAVPSRGSLLLILYGIPTLATGIAMKFRPMLIGSILCYLFFIASCYLSAEFDWLFNGLAAIANWLIPGLILRHRQLKGNAC